jgi:hypothetical protein
MCAEPTPPLIGNRPAAVDSNNNKIATAADGILPVRGDSRDKANSKRVCISSNGTRGAQIYRGDKTKRS